MIVRIARRAATVACVLSLCCCAVQAGPELVTNGSFDDPDNPLTGWMYDYTEMGNSWYMGNHKHVSTATRDGTRKDVVRLWGDYGLLQAPGQGVRIDSDPIPFEYGEQYLLSVYARTTGPDARIMIEGYAWKPGIKPHEKPSLLELRKVYKQGDGSLVYFGGKKSGKFSSVRGSWQKGTTTFPRDKKDLSKLALQHLRRVRFMVVHIIAISGKEGHLFIDDVSVTKK